MKQKELELPIQRIHTGSSSGKKTSSSFISETLFSNLSEIIIKTDLNGTIISSSRSFENNTITQMKGKQITEILSIEKKKIINTIKEVIQKRTRIEIEYHSSQCNRWYDIKVIPELENNNSIDLYFLINEITENKNVLENKVFENEFVSKLIDIASFIVMILDTEGNIVKVNPYFERISGYRREEIEGKNWFDIFLSKEDHIKIKKVFKQALNNKPNQALVNSIIVKGNKNITIEWYDSPLSDLEGKVVGLLTIGKDITERVAAENALQTSTAQLAIAMRVAKIGYWEYDFKNDLFTFNNQFYQVFQTNVEEVGGYSMSVNRYLELFVPIDDRKLIRKFIKDTKDLNNITDGEHLEHKIKLKDGSFAYISLRIIALRDEENKILKIIGANQDITERIEYEEALKKSEAQLSNAMQISRLASWEYDVATNLFTFNDHFYSIFKTNIQEVGTYQMTPEDYAARFLYPDDMSIVVEETRKALESPDPNYSHQLEHRIIYSDDQIGYISVRIFIKKDNNGKTIKTYGVNQDITERKRIERKLEEQNAKYAALNIKLEESLDIVKNMNLELEIAKNKAEENDKLKSAFLANMSHEIRTPMNGIIGFSKMLNRHGLSEERRHQYTEIINDMSHQLLHMIDEIIDISKIETGQLVVRKSKTNVNDIFIRLFSNYKSIAERNNINLYVQKGLSDEHSEVYTDSTKLRQVLDNLLRNAIKFTHQGYVKFGYMLKDSGYLEFYVEDTGIGIAPEMQGTIFERFRQAEEGVNKLYGGTGLGLSITKSFVEKLGGSIWVDSTPGNGAIFYFTIPFLPTTLSGAQFFENSKKENHPKVPTIMVVEDEEVNYLFIEEVLLESDIKILHAKRGREAIDMFKADPEIDLILLDIKLPDINGIEVLKEIKKLKPTIPIIAQTAYALSGDMESALEAGFDDYIAKPIDDKELIDKIGYYIMQG